MAWITWRGSGRPRAHLQWRDEITGKVRSRSLKTTDRKIAQ